MKLLSKTVIRHETAEQAALSKSPSPYQSRNETGAGEIAELVELDTALLSWESQLPADLKLQPHAETAHEIRPHLFNRPAAALRLR